jgi:hypothetical protein
VSFYMHLRAVPESEAGDDHSSLTTFMRAAWEIHAEEYEAGLAESVNKDFAMVHEFYETAAGRPQGADGPGSCPCSAAVSCAIRRRSSHRSRSSVRQGWRGLPHSSTG